MNPPLELGTIVILGDEEWEIASVMLTCGERYYMLTDHDNGVTMYPAFMLEEDRALPYPK